MKIVAISDTHHQHYYVKLPRGDILIHAGDFSARGEPLERVLVMDWLKHISKNYAYVIIIMGNHDISMSKDWYNQRCLIHERIPNLTWLQDDYVLIDKLKIYGSPYTVRFGDWGFGETEDKLMKRFSHIPKDTDILITHGPPYSILDQNKNGENCGSKSLYERIKKLPNLKYHIFGHIHENGGRQEIVEDVKFCNVSILDEYYKIKNKPTIIEIN